MIDFRQPYKRKAYLDFFRDHFLPEDFSVSEEKLDYKTEHIQDAVKLADVPSLDLTIYEVRHKSEHDPRVSLSRDTFRMLSEYSKSKALVLFTPKSKANYRLSLVTIDITWEEGKRVKKEYSNPRRYSFYLGPDTKTHTPEEYLIKKGRVKDVEDLKNRFSIEVVNKEFYTQIAVLFTQLAGGKRTIGRKSIDAGRGLLNLPGTIDDTLDKEFTVRFLGRLVFCWFLKKKRSSNDIPFLPEELLSVNGVENNKGYYHGILEPLFFEVLNTPVDDRDKKYHGKPWSQIPFLNGGLFTPHHHDFYDPGPLGISKHINTLKVPDNWIKELFEIFETYNFTIDENTSVDVELSIEPEMLGRIFENLLAEINPETGETARKATGSYYTPRPIVEYMVDESLKQYLLTKTKLNDEQIKSLLTYEDLAIKLTASEKEAVLSALDAVRVIDPACGSGAFPMGILQKMLLILQKVDPESEWWLDKKLAQVENKLLKKELGKKLKAENVNYVHKLGIIQSSIYGIDIQPIAVEISKLRFFLSLIVDEKINDQKENRGVEPLPNLEFKFVCANTLIGLPEQKKPEDELFESEDTRSINELKDLRDEYLRSYGVEKEKIQIKFLKIQKKMVEFYWKRITRPQYYLSGEEKKIRKQEEPKFTRMLSSWDPFSDEPAGWFDPEWMFGIKDGFDIVIANPPYVDSEHMTTINLAMRDKYKEMYKSAKGNWDLYIIFVEKGLNLLSAKGTLAYIVPNKLIASSYSESLRSMLLDNNIVSIRDYSSVDVFKEIDVYPIIICIQKEMERQTVRMEVMDEINHCAVKNLIKEELFYKDIYWDIFFAADSKIISIIDKIMTDERIDANYGLISGAATVSEAYKFKKVIKEHTTGSSSLCKKLINSGTIDKYISLWGKTPLRYIKDRYDSPIISNDDIKSISKQRFAQSCSEKIILAGMIKDLEAFFDAKGDYIAGKSTIIIQKNEIDLRYITALLNSKLMSFFYRHYFNSLSMAGGYLSVGSNQLVKLPVLKIRHSEQEAFIGVVSKILDLSKETNYFEDNKKQTIVQGYIESLDRMIYKLYNLNEKEIQVIEDFYLTQGGS